MTLTLANRNPDLTRRRYEARSILAFMRLQSFTTDGTASSSGGDRQRRRRTTEIVPAGPSGEEVLKTEDTLREILTWLTAKELFRFTLVSKEWNSLITEPELIYDWRRHPKSPVALFLRRTTLKKGKIQYSRVPLAAANCGGATIRPTNFSLDFVPDRITIEQSSNGLMICSSSVEYYIYNPTTKQFLQIPRLNHERKSVLSMNLAFEAPEKYTIIAVCTWEGIVDAHLEIYDPRDLSRHWREPGLSFPFSCLGEVIYDYGVCMDGAVYWPGNSKGLAYFKIKEEQLVWLPDVPRPCNSYGNDSLYFGDDILYFGECRGKLRLARCSSIQRGDEFDMLELERDLSAWFVKYHIDLTVRAPDLMVDKFFVLALLPGNEVEGESSSLILYFQDYREVVSYSFADQTLKKVFQLKLRGGDLNALRMKPWKNVHPCLETFLRP